LATRRRTAFLRTLRRMAFLAARRRTAFPGPAPDGY
jgi:hypothetical protein